MMMMMMIIITFTSRINVSGYLVCGNLFRQLLPKNLLPQEPMSRRMQLRYIVIDRFIFRSNFPGMRLPWECHDQSQETNWHHWVTRPELPFFHKRKDILKIDQSAKRPWHRLIIGVACSYSLAPGSLQCRRLVAESDDLLLCSICSSSLSCRRVGWMLGGNGVGWRNSFLWVNGVSQINNSLEHAYFYFPHPFSHFICFWPTHLVATYSSSQSSSVSNLNLKMAP